ncbi:very short patch repair endonuclease [Alcaligenes nematophilus]|uniref:very short patch repair endonuclease n=1 Tax=Alcaligenes TaxID=507 RepID=UPI001AFCC30D|nr:very short patch repair endonuclease [Alcaligenes faecalis]QRF88868.1 very short patch repair endonuclease [Alcaligenes faecalis]
MDIHSPEQRSFNMSRIKGANTRPEMLVRKWLWANGYRYRLHARDLPGKPDIVFRGRKAAIFVHGCFWHRHGCRYTTMPSTRQEFWIKKFADNMERDKKNAQFLCEQSWNVLLLWECEIKSWSAKAEPKLNEFLRDVFGTGRKITHDY